jgi:hypothetical protein
MGKIELIEGAWRGYVIEFTESYAGCAFFKGTKFGADMFVGKQIEGVGEIFRCSKDDVGLFIAVRNRTGKIVEGRWTHTHSEPTTEFQFDKTTGESRCMITKYPLLEINYEEDTHGPNVVYVGT